MENNKAIARYSIVKSIGGVSDQEFGRGSLSPEKNDGYGRVSPPIETEEMRQMDIRFNELNEKSKRDTEKHKEKEMRLYKKVKSENKIKNNSYRSIEPLKIELGPVEKT